MNRYQLQVLGRATAAYEARPGMTQADIDVGSEVLKVPVVELDMDSGTLYVAGVAVAGGGGAPGGANKDVQINNGGAFGGAVPPLRFNYDRTTGIVELGVPDSSLNPSIQGFWGSEGKTLNLRGLPNTTSYLGASFLFDLSAGGQIGIGNIVYSNNDLGAFGIDCEVIVEPALGHTASQVIGVQGKAINYGPGTAASVVGMQYLTINYGPVGTMVTVDLLTPVNNDTISECYGLRIGNVGGKGAVLGHALHIADQGTGANDYAIRVMGGKSTFGVDDSALNAALQGFWGSNVLTEKRFIVAGGYGLVESIYGQATDNSLEGIGMAIAAFQTGNTAIYVNGGDYEVFGYPSAGKTMDHAFGSYCFAANSGAGAITDVAGFVASVQNNGAGSTTNLMGALIGPILVPTGTAANISGVRIQSIAGLASTRGAALLIDDQGMAAKDYAIRVLGGKVGIGLDLDDAAFDANLRSYFGSAIETVAGIAAVGQTNAFSLQLQSPASVQRGVSSVVLGVGGASQVVAAGSFAGAFSGSLTATSVSGAEAWAFTIGAAAVTELIGLNISGNYHNDSGTAANNYGIKIAAQHGVGTHSAALYITDQGAGAGDYAIDVVGGKCRFAGATKNGAPTASDLAAGQWTIYKDSGGGGVALYYNDGGTIKSVALA